ncbi:hypothetical protein EVAR_86958_1 [Eumeta japonica]|uniref:Uncharacterized protein n=1 Tax=Eumeta variegata TaxID=151549 RepID=A0A4C1W998_EUMVA|nr:hypothetical protein EVAR_86958_1 [Eumeta japonica]
MKKEWPRCTRVRRRVEGRGEFGGADVTRGRDGRLQRERREGGAGRVRAHAAGAAPLTPTTLAYVSGAQNTVDGHAEHLCLDAASMDRTRDERSSLRFVFFRSRYRVTVFEPSGRYTNGLYCVHILEGSPRLYRRRFYSRSGGVQAERPYFFWLWLPPIQSSSIPSAPGSDDVTLNSDLGSDSDISSVSPPVYDYSSAIGLNFSLTLGSSCDINATVDGRTSVAVVALSLLTLTLTSVPRAGRGSAGPAPPPHPHPHPVRPPAHRGTCSLAMQPAAAPSRSQRELRAGESCSFIAPANSSVFKVVCGTTQHHDCARVRNRRDVTAPALIKRLQKRRSSIRQKCMLRMCKSKVPLAQSYNWTNTDLGLYASDMFKPLEEREQFEADVRDILVKYD